MVISALTTLLAIAAVVVVIGYRMYGAHGNTTLTDGIVMLPKGAHVISTTVTASTIAVTIDVDGADEVRIYDRRNMQQVGRLRFGTELALERRLHGPAVAANSTAGSLRLAV